MVEESGRSAEDEVGGPGDVAAVEILAPRLRQQRILISQKAAIAKDAAVAENGQRYRLTLIAGGVFKRQIQRAEIVGLHEDGLCGEGVDRAFGAGQSRVRIASEDRLHRVVAAQGEERFGGGHGDAFRVGSGQDVDDGVRPRRIDCGLHGMEGPGRRNCQFAIGGEERGGEY